MPRMRTDRNVGSASDVWSDYLGDSIYGDYTVAGGTATMTRRYVPGEWQTDVQAAATSFFHTNMLGTTRLLSNNLGTAIPDANRLYTAYGVPIAGPASPTTRYGYAGMWGYQEHEDLSILHVGARYYAPSTGRFLQRDPIGIDAGLNVYAYVNNMPFQAVDPSGLLIWFPDITPEQFLEATGGMGETFFDRWGNRLRGRTVPAGAGTVTGKTANLRRRKPPGQLPGSKSTTHRAGEWLRRHGFKKAQRFARRAGPIAMACGVFADLYILGKEGIYGYYDIPPGIY